MRWYHPACAWGVMALLAIGAGCTQPTVGNDKPSQPLLTVNGRSVSVDRYREIVELLREELGGTPVVPRNTLEQIRQAGIRQLIEETLVEQQADAYGISVTEGEIEREIEALHGSDPHRRNSILRRHYTTDKEFRDAIRRQLLRDKLIDRLFPAPQTIAEADLRAYWRERRKDLPKGKRIHLLQIVVAKKQLADQLYRKLRRHPERFQEAARQHSITPEGQNGGDLGWVNKNELPKVFARAFRLPPGKVGRPVKSPYGYHIFLVQEKHNANEDLFDVWRPKLERELKLRLQQERYRKGIQQWIAAAKIEINEELLAQTR